MNDGLLTVALDRCSIRVVPSRTSGENRDRFAMAPTSHTGESPGIPGRFRGAASQVKPSPVSCPANGGHSTASETSPRNALAFLCRTLCLGCIRYLFAPRQPSARVAARGQLLSFASAKVQLAEDNMMTIQKSSLSECGL